MKRRDARARARSTGRLPHAGDAARDLYVDASLHVLLQAFAPRLQGTDEHPLPDDAPAVFADFAPAYARHLDLPCLAGAAPSAQSFFASCAQVGRTRRLIARAFIGTSRPMAALRAAVCDAILTCDLRDAVQAPLGMMDDLPVLVTGPTGTGKELVAQTLGKCRFVPFDGKRWVTGSGLGVPSVNVAALSGTLLESELFGHRRGAFTGATETHRGWFESCTEGGVLFLDEIGELALPAQPKLLRVLETRKFQRVGETTDVDFHGRLVTATQVDLGAAVTEGNFRMDLFQRLSAVMIHTPSLQEQLADTPGDLELLVCALAQRVRPSRAEPLAERTLEWIEGHLRGYGWPGNVRELLQCVRGVMTKGRWDSMITRTSRAKAPKAPPAPTAPPPEVTEAPGQDAEELPEEPPPEAAGERQEKEVKRGSYRRRSGSCSEGPRTRRWRSRFTRTWCRRSRGAWPTRPSGSACTGTPCR